MATQSSIKLTLQWLKSTKFVKRSAVSSNLSQVVGTLVYRISVDGSIRVWCQSKQLKPDTHSAVCLPLIRIHCLESSLLPLHYDMVSLYLAGVTERTEWIYERRSGTDVLLASGNQINNSTPDKNVYRLSNLASLSPVHPTAYFTAQ